MHRTWTLLILVACGPQPTALEPSADEDEWNKADFEDGKADDLALPCRDGSSSCDACFEALWYDDGACDTFCERRDPDCFSFDASDTTQTIGCYENEWGSDLVLRIEGSDLIINGTWDEGTYPEVCTWDATANDIRCDFGLDEEVHVDLTLQRKDSCDTMWEATDLMFYLDGTYDGGLFSSEVPILCVLERYERVSPC